MGRKPKILEPHRQTKGDGNLTLRNGIWYMRLTVDGKQISKSTGLKEHDKVKAYKMLEDFVRPYKAKDKIEQYQNLQARINVQEIVLNSDERTRRKVKWDEMLDVYFKRGFSQDCAVRTRETYEFIISRLKSWAKKNHKHPVWMDDWTITDAEEYVDYMRKSWSPRYFNSSLHFIKWVWKCLKSTDVWCGFKDRVVGESNRKAFTVEQLNAIFNYLENGRKHKYNEELLLLIKVGMYTGLRLGDACHLKFSDIDFSSMILKKTPHKTKRYMTKVEVPIHPALLGDLQNAVEKRRDDEEYVMPYMRHQYECRSITARLREMFNQAGITTCIRSEDKKSFKSVYCFHSFRHTFVSMCANAGTPQNEVMKLVGHHTPRMTAKYYHSDIEQARRYLSSIPEVGSNAKPVVPKVDIKLDKDIYDFIMKKSQDVNVYLRKMLFEDVLEAETVDNIPEK